MLEQSRGKGFGTADSEDGISHWVTDYQRRESTLVPLRPAGPPPPCDQGPGRIFGITGIRNVKKTKILFCSCMKPYCGFTWKAVWISDQLEIKSISLIFQKICIKHGIQGNERVGCGRDALENLSVQKWRWRKAAFGPYTVGMRAEGGSHSFHQKPQLRDKFRTKEKKSSCSTT